MSVKINAWQQTALNKELPLQLFSDAQAWQANILVWWSNTIPLWLWFQFIILGSRQQLGRGLGEQMSGVNIPDYPEEKADRTTAKDKINSSHPHTAGHQKALTLYSSDATKNKSDEALITAGHSQPGPNTGIIWRAWNNHNVWVPHPEFDLMTWHVV